MLHSRLQVRIELILTLCCLPFLRVDHVRFESSRFRAPPCITDHPYRGAEPVSCRTEDDYRATLFSAIGLGTAVVIVGELRPGHD